MKRRVSRAEYLQWLEDHNDYYQDVCGICEPPALNTYDAKTDRLIAQVICWETDPESPMYVKDHPEKEYFVREEEVSHEQDLVQRDGLLV